MGVNTNPISPKVTSSSLSGAVTIVLLYVLGQVPFVAALPADVKAAAAVILTVAATFAAGYLKRDPNRTP